MKMIWKGKLTKENPLPSVPLPPHATAMMGSRSKFFMYIAAISSIVFSALMYFLKAAMAPSMSISTTGIAIGAVLAILCVFLQDLVPILGFPKNGDNYVYLTSSGLRAVTTSPMTKQRYIWAHSLAAIALGLLPLVLWLVLPPSLGALGSMLFVFGLVSICTTAADMDTIAKAFEDVPPGAMVQRSGTTNYWYMPEGEKSFTRLTRDK